MTMIFGSIPAWRGDVRFTSALSDDKRALTLVFSEGATAEVGTSPAPMASREFSVVLPLEGDGGRVEMEFILQSGVELSAGATGTVVLSVNGQSSIADFVVATSETFVQRLNFVAEAPCECRVFALLVAGRDSVNPDTAASLNFVDLNAEFLPRPT